MELDSSGGCSAAPADGVIVATGVGFGVAGGWWSAGGRRSPRATVRAAE
ncbi:hypothetical protein DAI22_04g251000 [Oryza sativa Japonica Group]|nr:hypothetical protein DAI22_04g251000 [Oryza sativa Japonica Group]